MGGGRIGVARSKREWDVKGYRVTDRLAETLHTHCL